METLTKLFYEYAKNYIVDGVKGMHRICELESYPMYFDHGSGAYIWDIDNKRYIDFVMGKGPYILGYRNEIVENAVIEQVKRGNIFPAGTPIHVYLAKEISRLVPSMEKVLFYKTGSCATQASIRFARNYTKKSRIYTSGYHGWHECYEKKENDVIDFNYSLDKLEKQLKNSVDNAAVIISPEEFYFSSEYYQKLEMLCKKYDTLLIFDEVKTGFRVGLGGFQGKMKLSPDLTIISKAIANGYSIAAVGGKKEIMDSTRSIHTSGTFDTEAIPFAAALATTSVLETENVLFKIESLGKKFVLEMEKIFEKNDIPINVVWSNGSFRFWFRNNELEDFFYEESVKNGISFYPYDNSFISYAHNQKCLYSVLDIFDNKIAKKITNLWRGYEKFDFRNINSSYINRKQFLDKYPGREG